MVRGSEFRGYLYKESYIRTSCRDYSMNSLENRFVHLTNDAIQKKSVDYGKYETGNKISQDEFSAWLEQYHQLNYTSEIQFQLKNIVRHSLEAFSSKLQKVKNFNNFEVSNSN